MQKSDWDLERDTVTGAFGSFCLTFVDGGEKSRRYMGFISYF